jgi:hypothetical protein
MRIAFRAFSALVPVTAATAQFHVTQILSAEQIRQHRIAFTQRLPSFGGLPAGRGGLRFGRI